IAETRKERHRTRSLSRMILPQIHVGSMSRALLLTRPAWIVPMNKVSLLLTLDEREQILIHSVFEGCTHAVRCALVDLELCVLDDFGRHHRRGADGDDLVIVSVHDQFWHIKFLEIFSQICLGKRLDAKIRARKTAHPHDGMTATAKLFCRYLPMLPPR